MPRTIYACDTCSHVQAGLHLAPHYKGVAVCQGRMKRTEVFTREEVDAREDEAARDAFYQGMGQA